MSLESLETKIGKPRILRHSMPKEEVNYQMKRYLTGLVFVSATTFSALYVYQQIIGSWFK